MRKFFFMLCALSVLCLSAQKVDDIFTIAPDDTIQTKPVYYKEVKFNWPEMLELKDLSTETIRTQNQTPYTVKLWADKNNPFSYMFNSIEIRYDNRIIYSVKNEEVWRNAILANGSTRLYEVIPLSQTASAILFLGWRYDSTPPLLTIVVVNKGKAKLVFNRHCCFLNYENKNGTFSITYSDQIQEIPYEGAPLEPADNELNKFRIWKSDGILKFQQIQ